MFCGCARLTQSLRRVGFRAFGIDWGGNKDGNMSRGVTLKIDLRQREGRDRFWALMDDPLSDIQYAHFAPTCGTASRAREIRRAEGLDPNPLRSLRFPNGLPELSG